MHDLIIPARYLAPKWQAYVTPKDKNFVFSNGVSISSLWSLKQALLRLPEDIITGHIAGESNDLANWVRAVVGDDELADELVKYNHRWGIIVALERQMMRTLNLPHYLATRWLAPVENVFTFSSGQQVASLYELREVLNQVDDGTVAFHQERSPNDISVWVSDIIGDYELGDLLDEANSRVQMQRFVADHIEMLEEAAKETH